MKNKAIILILFWMAAAQIFATSLFTTIYENDDCKIIHSPFQLKAEDFKDSDFFLKDIKNSYYTDLNVQIFNLIKSKAKDYVIDPDFDFLKNRFKKGELILVPKDLISECLLFYAKYDDREKSFRIYYFLFEMTENDYKTYKENIQYYEKCIKNINWCNWVIENCSSPISKEAVAYNNRPSTTMRIGGSYDASNGSYDTGTETYGYDRPRISEKNPNYDPDKVAIAKKNLPLWEKDKTATQEKLKYLPFKIYQDKTLFQ